MIRFGHILLGLTIALGSVNASFAQDRETPQPKKVLRIIAFGAHPDDAEFQIGGCAIKWAKLGHKVKFISATNGDIGHWEMAGGPLAKRRTAEVKEAAKRMGIEVEVLDIHDGELEHNRETRKIFARKIREWQADLVFGHRPNDYHPDHRNVGLNVRDAAFMVRVPFYVPDTEHLDHNPVFMYFPDNFTKPYPFQADIAISIDDVFDQKLHAIDALESQVYEGGALGSPETLVERSADNPEARKLYLRKAWERRQGNLANRFRDQLVEWYGEEEGKEVKYCEAFEVCEYGKRPSKEELLELFPFFDSEGEP